MPYNTRQTKLKLLPLKLYMEINGLFFFKNLMYNRYKIATTIYFGSRMFDPRDKIPEDK